MCAGGNSKAGPGLPVPLLILGQVRALRKTFRIAGFASPLIFGNLLQAKNLNLSQCTGESRWGIFRVQTCVRVVVCGER